MLQLLKRLSWLALLACGSQVSFAFSLIGPVNEAYQVNVIGYNLPFDIGAPKNLAQEYRRNTPVIYYTADANFWDYFGARGVAEIDKAAAAFNNLPPVSTMSADLSEFPLISRRKNWRAEALFMWDLKSIVMGVLIEQLGLTDPERYIWTLHDRFLPAGATCPLGEVYLVIKRNFDPIIGTSFDQLKPTSYVNGTLFSYQIPEFCNAPLPPQAYCQPIPVDAEADTSTAVASQFGLVNNEFFVSPYGAYFTGLTRDDVGGLRYLLRAGNMNVEFAGPNTQVLVTNFTAQLIVSSNLTLLAAQAITNDPVTLSGLYPNVLILSSSNYFVNVNITNVTAYFTNFPWDPIGTAAHIAFVTNVTPTVATRYVHTFGNLLELIPTDSGWITVPISTLPAQNGQQTVTIQTTSVAASNNPWAPAGSLLISTNSSFVTYQTNAVVGDYITVPTNFCDIAIVTGQLTNVVTYTNIIVSLTNLVTTNGIGTTNAGTVLSYTQSLIGYTTNHTFVIYPVTCDTANTNLNQGIEKVTFIRRDYDSLLTRFFIPITNEYVLTSITNNTPVAHRVRRTVTAPDILFTAADLTPGPDARPAFNSWARSINFDTGTVYPGLAGPGTIETPTLVTFNNVGPIYENLGLINTNAYLTELAQIPLWIWGSFDGTTNPPVIYPNDLSITEMEIQVLVQVSPQYLSSGVVGVDYFGQLQAQSSSPNFVPPFFWSLAPNSPALPPGLQIMTGGDGSGLIFGAPTVDGTFDFIVRVSDSQGQIVDRSYSIRIDPP